MIFKFLLYLIITFICILSLVIGADIIVTIIVEVLRTRKSIFRAIATIAIMVVIKWILFLIVFKFINRLHYLLVGLGIT